MAPAAFGDALVSAGTANRLRLKSRTESEIAIGEGFKLLSFSWPVKIIAILKSSGAQTTVDYSASNFGFGPVQAGHCRMLLETVTVALADREAKP